MDIDYFEIPGVPGRYFRCPCGMGELSTRACGDSHRRSHRPVCRACAVGALHAGVRASVEASRLQGVLFCPRCERHTGRLVKGVCLSCYNREREWVVGKNRKGNAPSQARRVFSASLATFQGGRVETRRVDRVCALGEAVLVILAQSGGPVLFGE